MWPLTIEIGPLGEKDRPALGLHMLALDADDRRSRFGLGLGDASVLAWVHHIRWQETQWTGAWGEPGLGLLGAVQLAPTGRAGHWELAMTVARPLRRQGLGTALLASALRDGTAHSVRGLVCLHGHPSLHGMARRLGLDMHVQVNEPRVRLLVGASRFSSAT